MARLFTKNTSNKITTGVGTYGPLWGGASVLAFHCWGRLNSITGGTVDNRFFASIFGSNLTMFSAFIDGSGTPKRFGLGGRSATGDSFQSRTHTGIAINLGVWYSFGGFVDVPNKQVVPYVNGLRSPVTLSATFANSTFTDNGTGRTEADGIGLSAGTTVTTAGQFDGLMADLTIWKNARLSSMEWMRLAQGYPSYLIRPGKIINRYTLSDAGAVDLVSAKNGTIAGTVNLVPYEPFRYSSIRPNIPFFDQEATVANNSNFFAFMGA